jgi:hypothetical protein
MPRVGRAKPSMNWRKWNAKDPETRDVRKPVSGFLRYQGQHRGLHFSVDQPINCFHMPGTELDFGCAGGCNRAPGLWAG